MNRSHVLILAPLVYIYYEDVCRFFVIVFKKKHLFLYKKTKYNFLMESPEPLTFQITSD